MAPVWLTPCASQYASASAIDCTTVRDADPANEDAAVEPINQLCEREGRHLVDTHEELDVSGGAPLEKRHGLQRAIEAIEQGQAGVLAVAYFDRLVRSVKVQTEAVERVEAVGGRVLLADFGDLANGAAAQWLSGTLMGAVSEYVRRSIAERSAAGQAVAIERGHWPVILLPGYRRAEDGKVSLSFQRRSLPGSHLELGR